MGSLSRRHFLVGGVASLFLTGEDRAELEAVFLFGIPGAGKTSIAVRRFAGYKVFDPDLDPTTTTEVKIMRGLRAAREMNQNVLLADISSADIRHRRILMKYTRSLGYRTRLIYVKVRLETALARNNSRKRRVPEATIREQAAKVEAGFRTLKQYADVAEILTNDRVDLDIMDVGGREPQDR